MFSYIFPQDISNANSTINGCMDPIAENYNIEANFDDGTCSYDKPKQILFEKSISYWIWHYWSLDPFSDSYLVDRKRLKPLNIKTTYTGWYSRFLNPIKRITKLKKNFEAGLVDNTIVLYTRYDGVDILPPFIATMDWYKEQRVAYNNRIEFQKYIIKNLLSEKANTSGKNIVFDYGLVSLKINGNISVDGKMIFQDKDLVSLNQNNNKSWDLDVEQTQRFNIEGNIGDYFTIEVQQDSEADFAWENNMFLKYKGKDNDIFKSAEAGNISLNLPSTRFVSVGSGNSAGLFGIKMEHAIGPVTIKTILSREQVKKSSTTINAGQSSDPISINDYNFIKDRYFFITEAFKYRFYPLSEKIDSLGVPGYQNRYYSDEVIARFKIYKTTTDDVPGVIRNGKAYINPFDESSTAISGRWIELTQGVDYDFYPKHGYIRLGSSISQNEAVAIAYSLGSYNEEDGFIPYPQLEDECINFEGEICLEWVEKNNIEGYQSSFNSLIIPTGTNPYFLPDVCYGSEDADGLCDNFEDNDGVEGYTPDTELVMKLIKENTSTNPFSPTWPLMFKNVYYLGASNMDVSKLELNIVHDQGAGLETTHAQNGESYLTIFGLDRLNSNEEEIPDGQVDLKGTYFNSKYGELLLPFHMPFAYDSNPRYQPAFTTFDNFDTYWGINNPALADILDPLNDNDNSFSSEDSGPAMYYSTTNVEASHEFLIKVKHSSGVGSTISLDGFMIVEGSETVYVNGVLQTKGEDYNVDYMSGTISFLNPDEVDPNANIEISFEENELISFDQKILAGTHIKYNINEKDFISGGLFFYNQSIAEKKVDVGQEPMRNFIWNINGKVERELNFLTKAVNVLPFFESTKPSFFTLEGEYAEVYPNPNSLASGEAFIDDFESSKRTISPSIMQRQWKPSSIPADFIESCNEQNTDYNQELIEKYLNSRWDMSWYNPYVDVNTNTIWPDIETSTRANNTTTKTLWLQTYQPESDLDNGDIIWNGITTQMYNNDYAQSKYLDVWVNANSISDDDIKLNIDIGYISEDYNCNDQLDTEDFNDNNNLEIEEDIGLDGCPDEYEDGLGGCTCDYPLFCNSDDMVNGEDPNNDNWFYEAGSADYSQANNYEGNSQAEGFIKPDTEDLNSDYSLDYINDYFTTNIYPKSINDPYYITETEKDGAKTGWKLFRIPLSNFSRQGLQDIQWNNTKPMNMRIWLESEYDTNNQYAHVGILKIAKIEIVGNEWQELGIAHIDSIYTSTFAIDSTKAIEVINTDENPEYEMPADDIQEVDVYTGTMQREQSLVLSFVEEAGCSGPNCGGIQSGNIYAINKILPPMSADQQNSFFAYENLKMYVYGGNPSDENPALEWPADDDSSDIELLFRIGSGDRFYEIRQPIFDKWDERNHVYLNMDALTKQKNFQVELDVAGDDTGSDGCFDILEDGNGGCFCEYDANNICNINDKCNGECGSVYDSISNSDPNGDNGQIEWYCVEDDEYYDFEIDCLDLCDFSSNENSTEQCFPFQVEVDCEELSSDNQEWECSNNLGAGVFSSEEECDLATTCGVNEDSYCILKYSELNGCYDIGERYIDNDNNNSWTNPFELASYDNDNDLWVWSSDSLSLNNICGNCTELRIKEKPAINNLEDIIIGVINKSEETLYGKVLVDELRMSGVKKEKGQAFRIQASVDFADLLNVTTSYEKKDANFHLLQQRLGTGNNTEDFNINAKLQPHLFLPTKWGIKTPVNINYTHSKTSPKYIPGSDILAGDIDVADESVQTINDKITLSSSFNKTSRSNNWYTKYTIDNVSLNASAVLNNKSTSTIQSEEYLDLKASAKYSHNFGKENYINIFTYLDFLPLFGKFLSESRLYYTPDKFSMDISLVEFDKVSIQRPPISTVTPTYNLNMERAASINYKITKSFSTNYAIGISSNLDHYKDNKIDFINNLDPGIIKNISEKFSNTYSPDYLTWLNPKVTYNTVYTWKLTSQTDSLSLASTSVTAPLKTSVSISPKEIVELFYSPSSGSSNSRRGRRSSSSKKSKIYEFQNPVIKSILGQVHSLFKKVSKIKINNDHSENHQYNNILADSYPDYYFKLGLTDEPSNLSYDSNSGSYSKTTKIDDLRSISTSLNITPSFQISKLDYKTSRTESKSSSSIIVNTSETFLPMGLNGDEGFSFINWNINWSKLEKINLFKNIFQAISFSHSFSTRKEESFNDGVLQSWNYERSLSPLIGVNIKTKGKNYYKLNSSFSNTLNIINSYVGTPTSRTYNNRLNVAFSHQRKGGLKIPLVIFEDFYIENDIKFEMNVTWDQNYTLIAPIGAQSIDDFNEDSRTMSLLIKPNITYSFTRWVNGNLYFMYEISENKTTGRTTNQDFGFRFNIRIQG